jgi:hypothetical protein
LNPEDIMAEAYSLDTVIQKVDTAVRAGDNERAVIVDCKKKRAVAHRLPWGEYRQYLVRNDADPRHEAWVEVQHVVLRDLEHTVKAAMSMQLSCPPGNEERVAAALCDPARSPLEMLQAHVERWLSDICRNSSVEAFVRLCFADRTQHQRTVADAVLRDTGLRAQVKVWLHAEKSFDPIPLDFAALRVRVKDYDEEQEMALRVSMEVDPENQAAAVLHFPDNDKLRDRVTKEVGSHIRQGVTLQEFCTQLSTGAARDRLAGHLDAVLASAGRRVGALVLQARAPEGVQFSLPAEVPVVCRVHEFPQDIVINNKVLLMLNDLARYRRAGSLPLEEWLQKKLNEAIPQLLFDTRYIDLLINFQPVEDRIKEALRDEAAAIGYEIKQFVTVPDLEPIQLRNNFEIRIEEGFETALRGVDVKLQVVVTARIPRLEAIEDLLNRRQDVRRMMADSLNAALRQTLHEMDPERIYMRFNHSDRGERPVQDELKDLLGARLKSEFHAEIIGIAIKMAETKLIERFRRLQERICSFAVQVTSYHGGPAVVFLGDFRVLDVHPQGWHTFQLHDFGLDHIQEQLQKHLLSELQPLYSQRLRYREKVDHNEVKADLTKAATEYVADEFGLTIQITNVRRELTGIEMAAIAAETEIQQAGLDLDKMYRLNLIEAYQGRNQSIMGQIEKLQEKLLLAVGVEGAEEEVVKLQDNIESLRRSMGKAEISSFDEVRVEALGAPPRPLALAAATGGPAEEFTGAEPDDGQAEANVVAETES